MEEEERGEWREQEPVEVLDWDSCEITSLGLESHKNRAHRFRLVLPVCQLLIFHETLHLIKGIKTQ